MIRLKGLPLEGCVTALGQGLGFGCFGLAYDQLVSLNPEFQEAKPMDARLSTPNPQIPTRVSSKA